VRRFKRLLPYAFMLSFLLVSRAFGDEVTDQLKNAGSFVKTAFKLASMGIQLGILFGIPAFAWKKAKEKAEREMGEASTIGPVIWAGAGFLGSAFLVFVVMKKLLSPIGFDIISVINSF